MDFDEIPSTYYDPAIFLEIKPNYSRKGVFAYPEKVLIAGQKLAAGSLAIGAMVEITRADEGYALFGEGSIGAEMVAAFRNANKTIPLYAIALADADGATKATGTVTFAGATSVSSTLYFRIGGRIIKITALAIDDVAALATKLAAAVNADTRCTVTASAAAGVVTLTARNAGLCGNEIDVRVEEAFARVPSGLTVTVVAMSGGATNPDLQGVLDAIENTWITRLVFPWNDAANMAVAAAWLDARYIATVRLDCQAHVSKNGTYGELTTWGDLTNCKLLECSGLSKPRTSPWVRAAVRAAIASFYLTNDPARQLKSLVLTGVLGPDPEDQFLDEERNLLLQHGISSDVVLDDLSVVINRMITTYKKTSLNVADDAWMDIMVAATNSRIRYDWAAYMNVMYPRAKLVDDDKAIRARRSENDTAAGSAVVSPRVVKNTWAARCQLYADNVWIENISETIKASTFSRPAGNRNRLEYRLIYQIVGNLMVQAGSMEFLV